MGRRREWDEDGYVRLAPSKMTKRNSHKHQCPLCGFIWQHSDEMLGCEKAHKCPCGGQSWSHYNGSSKADYKGCGTPILTESVKAALSGRKDIQPA